MRVILAPMQGVLDPFVRELLTEVNDYDLCITEFVRVVDQLLPEKVFYRLWDAVLLHQSYRARAFTKLCVCKIMTRHTQSFSPLDDPCLRLVRDDHSHLRLACSAEMMDDSFGV